MAAPTFSRAHHQQALHHTKGRNQSAHKKAVQNRVLADGSRESFGEELLQNELNVLMTRGTRGMFIYAVDEQLREALLEAQERKLPHVE